MPRYVLEIYLSRTGALEDATARARLVGGGEVRYLRTTYVAEDETCFHVFEAASRDALLEAAARSGLAGARVIEAVESET